ncbi:hypothetical protein O6H91_22G058500 [Diphasiastrum complanatum]|uniref:Uncharacterized protein n=1 Tax=Diphasiastrum complanatum TaxID=34168 RepID=A0ACC2AHM8_DIPCM|nr:hypothetical protein O6H91_22G058500 [Diphasiastrum complanatum]
MEAAKSCAPGRSTTAWFDSRRNLFWLHGSAKIGLILAVYMCCFFLPGTVRATRLIDRGSLEINSNNVLTLKALLASGGSTSHQHGVGMKVFHRDAPHLRERKSRQATTLQNTKAVSMLKTDMHTQPGLESTTLRRQEDRVGQYYMPLQIGSPGRDILVILDTGSEILWVQCEPCNECGSQIIEPVFDPTLSSTYQPLSCNSQRCLQGGTGFETFCNVSQSLCKYIVQYADNSTSFGDLSVDTLTINSTSGSPTAITGFEFGCGHTNFGIEDDLGASGLLGLDRGNNSFISQISVHFPKVFFYCFPDRINNLNSSGFIHFGRSYDSQHLKYTPLLQNTASDFLSQFYYINVTGININGHLLPIPTAAFAIDASGNGGTILDTGTSLSILVDPAFNVLKEAFLNGTMNLKTLPDPSGNGLDVCYSVSASSSHLPKVPIVEFHLQGEGTKLRLSAENLLMVAAEDQNQLTLCLAMRSGGAVGMGRNVIGNYQQANHIVEVDIEKSRVGLINAHCPME